MLRRSLVSNGFLNIARDFPAALAKAQRETGEEIVEIILTSMEAPKHGAHYPMLLQQSSAPGEAPAIQSGELFDSITLSPTGDRITIESDHAAVLENGSADGTMAPRPFLAPAITQGGAILEDKLAAITRRWER